MLPVHRLFAPLFVRAGIILVTSAFAAPDAVAAEDVHDCPNHPEATYTLSGDPDADASQLKTLVEPAKERGAVCIVAFYDGAGPANGKMLAFRRANWAMEQLERRGVPPGIIARALHASDKANARMVQVILGP